MKLVALLIGVIGVFATAAGASAAGHTYSGSGKLDLGLVYHFRFVPNASPYRGWLAGEPDFPSALVVEQSAPPSRMIIEFSYVGHFCGVESTTEPPSFDPHESLRLLLDDALFGE